MGRGNVKFIIIKGKEVIFTDVLYLSEMVKNLISVFKVLSNSELRIYLAVKGCTVTDQVNRLILEVFFYDLLYCVCVFFIYVNYKMLRSVNVI